MTAVPGAVALAGDVPARPAAEGWLRVAARNAFPFVVVGGIWEIVAHAGIFPAALFPSLEQVAATFVRLTVTGILPLHAIETLARLLAGFSIAAVFGVTIGLLMGRSRTTEEYLLPLVS